MPLFSIWTYLRSVCHGSACICHWSHFPRWLLCIRTAPKPKLLASEDTVVSFSGLYSAITCSDVMSTFSCWKASCWGVSYIQASSLFSRSPNGFVFSARFGQNFIRWFTISKNLLTYATFWGTAMAEMALTFEGYFLIPIPWLSII